MECQICGGQSIIEPKYCCNGNDCGCLGQPVNEESFLCAECKEHVAYLEKLGCAVINKSDEQMYTEC